MRNESSEYKAGGNKSTTADTLLTEKINLGIFGYLYHPRLVSLYSRLSGGLQHEKFESPTVSSGWSTSTADEYEFRAIVLPEHPYNLELYTLRRTPLIRGRVLSKPVSTESGALFRYKERPYSLGAGYIVNTLESGGITTDSKTYSAYGSHSFDFMSNSLAYSHTDSSSLGAINTGDHYSFANQLFWNRFTLSSGIGLNTSHEKAPDSSILDFKTFSWTEGLDIPLPWNFSSNLSYNRNQDSEVDREAPSFSEIKTSNATNDVRATLSHRLYQSLFTTYGFGYATQRFNGGESESISNSLSTTYTKKIPYGTLFLGAGITDNVTDRNGSKATITEPSLFAALPSTVTLKEQFIDAASIVVRVVRPDTGALVELQKNDNYFVEQFGDSTRLALISVPLGVPILTNSAYEFRVSYSFLQGNVKLDGTGTSYNAGLSLFEGSVNPYYRYSRFNEKILSGSLPGGPQNSTTETVGLRFQQQSYFILAEHQEVRSDISPSKTLLTEAGYWRSLDDTTSFNADANYSKITYPNGISSSNNSRKFSEDSYGISAQVQKTFPERGLTLSFRGAASQRVGLTKINIYSFNTALTWMIGRMNISLGADTSFSESRVSNGKQEQINKFYYLNVKRNLF